MVYLFVDRKFLKQIENLIGSFFSLVVLRKRKVQSIIAPPTTRNNQRQRRNPAETIKIHSNITTVTSVNEKNVYPDLQSGSPVNKSPR